VKEGDKVAGWCCEWAMIKRTHGSRSHSMGTKASAQFGVNKVIVSPTAHHNILMALSLVRLCN